MSQKDGSYELYVVGLYADGTPEWCGVKFEFFKDKSYSMSKMTRDDVRESSCFCGGSDSEGIVKKMVGSRDVWVLDLRGKERNKLA